MSEPALPVLHLLDHRTPGLRDSLDACALMLQRAPEEQRVCLLGGSGLDAAAADAKLGPCDRIAVPLGEPTLGVRALRRLVLDRPGPVIVHAWSLRALRAARRAVPECPLACIEVAGLEAPTPGQTHLLRRAVLGACGPSARREWIGAGAARENVVLLPTPVAAAPVAAGDRARARESLGLEESDLALLLLGAAPWADAVRFMFLAGLLVEAGVEVVGLVPRDATQGSRGLRYIRTSPTGARFVMSDLPTPQLLAAADLAVFEGGGLGPSAGRPIRPAAATLAVSQALGRGVPVAAARDVVADVPGIEALHGAAWTSNGTLPELARALVVLASEPGLRSAIKDGGQRHFQGLNLQAEFVEAVRSIWGRVQRTQARAPVTAEARP